jgi:hypothetical protein
VQGSESDPNVVEGLEKVAQGFSKEDGTIGEEFSKKRGQMASPRVF